MKYTVTDITTSHILVKFEDGKKALVPIQSNWTKSDIEKAISKFIPKPMKEKVLFEKLADIPINVGDSNDIESYQVVREREEQIEKNRLKKESEDLIKKHKDIKVSYKEIRFNLYPSIGDQLDSLYHAGVFPTDMAEKIKAVKDAYPKDYGPITAEQLGVLIDKNESLDRNIENWVYIDGTKVNVPIHLTDDL